ncbi:hypothetical protein ACSBR1_011888 [Camellia fascicularis]
MSIGRGVALSTNTPDYVLYSYENCYVLKHAAHLDLDTSTSSFSVYDGHGGFGSALNMETLVAAAERRNTPLEHFENLRLLCLPPLSSEKSTLRYDAFTTPSKQN